MINQRNKNLSKYETCNSYYENDSLKYLKLKSHVVIRHS